MKEIRRLKPSEIEVRVGHLKMPQGNDKGGVQLLLYKDARCDMKILDEVYGRHGWQRHHQILGETIYCTISIWDDDKGIWIEKSDAGAESYTEKEKGAASDSFKRAAVNVGIGRELYTSPFIWASDVEIIERNGKPFCKDNFFVQLIETDEDGAIVKLVICRQRENQVVYRMGV